MVEHVVDRRTIGFEPEALDDLEQRLYADPATGDLGIKVAPYHLGHAGIGHDHAEDILVENPFLINLDPWKDHTFL